MAVVSLCPLGKGIRTDGRNLRAIDAPAIYLLTATEVLKPHAHASRCSAEPNSGRGPSGRCWSESPGQRRRRLGPGHDVLCSRVTAAGDKAMARIFGGGHAELSRILITALLPPRLRTTDGCSSQLGHPTILRIGGESRRFLFPTFPRSPKPARPRIRMEGEPTTSTGLTASLSARL
ncbi:hypothetical protein BC834DRAFT_869951 [Gloeopeniophorella convolvens]|nr:hypothetical protein BC834DRAFT_869951 [Gloeopeniophorella convolvens]